MNKLMVQLLWEVIADVLKTGANDLSVRAFNTTYYE